MLFDDRRDAHRYLRDLEHGLIATVAAYGVPASRPEGLTGVLVNQVANDLRWVALSP